VKNASHCYPCSIPISMAILHISVSVLPAHERLGFDGLLTER
jgi:hypothetical protein